MCIYVCSYVCTFICIHTYTTIDIHIKSLGTKYHIRQSKKFNKIEAYYMKVNFILINSKLIVVKWLWSNEQKPSNITN